MNLVDELHAIVAALRGAGVRYAVCGHVQRVSKIVGNEHLLLDLLVAEAAFAAGIDDVIEVALPEGPLAVVSRGTLVRMKQLAGRAQDVADLEKLEAGDGG